MNRLRCTAITTLVCCFSSVASAQFIPEWIHELSGPGPFSGWPFSCRTSLSSAAEPCDDAAVALDPSDWGATTELDALLLSDIDPADTDVTQWLHVNYSYRTGPRQNADSDGDDVIWHAVEATVETKWDLPAPVPRVYTGLGGTLNWFSGDAFEGFFEPGLKVTQGVRLPLVQSGSFRLDADLSVDFRFLVVEPEQFGLLPSTFAGGGEWLFGGRVCFYVGF